MGHITPRPHKYDDYDSPERGFVRIVDVTDLTRNFRRLNVPILWN